MFTDHTVRAHPETESDSPLPIIGSWRIGVRAGCATGAGSGGCADQTLRTANSPVDTRSPLGSNTLGGTSTRRGRSASITQGPMLRFHRRLACALALALSVSALWAAGAGAAIVGANANALFVGEWRGQVSSAQVDEQLTLMRATGVTDVRTDASWQDAEPAPGVYNWSHDDEIASRLAAHGLTWTAAIVYAAGWSNGTSAYATLTPGGTLVHPPPTPADYTNYAAYAAQVQARYHPAAIQIWNEPDLWAFWYRPDLQQDPAAYARLFELSRSAIKAVDPHARVMSTLSQFGRRFLAHVVAADPRYHPDALGWHTYYGTPQEDLGQLALR